ncbi:aldehyde dehydrogenase family protein, partial [Nocardia sp. NPDC060220]|uniref:aldehyde dehydrogenase family protein n=1 Tax=Nocardia sp. NPDC060220 TaxID=3347076 RepID=UPI00364B5200
MSDSATPTVDAAELAVRNPASGELVGTVAVSTQEEVAAAAAALRTAQPRWASISAAGRKQWLLKLQDWVLDHSDELADSIQDESGKPRV